MKQIPGTTSAGVSRLMISSWAVFVTAGSRHYISVATHRALPAFFSRDVLFICDYVMKEHGIMVINPFGPRDATRKGLARLIAMIPESPVKMVCGVDYVMDYPLLGKTGTSAHWLKSRAGSKVFFSADAVPDALLPAHAIRSR